MPARLIAGSHHRFTRMARDTFLQEAFSLYPPGPDHRPVRVVLGRFLVFVIGVQALWFFLPNTQAWLAFATWFRELPLT